MAVIEERSLRWFSADRTEAEVDLTELVREYSGMLYRVAFSVVRNADEAEDVVQDRFVRVDPHSKVYPVFSQNAIVIEAPQADLELAQRMLMDLDRPKKTYRLTYTVTEMDGGKRLGTQHFSMIVVAAQRTVIKQGSKVPVVTARDGQFTYEDIGMDFDVSLDEFANGVRLRSKVDATSVPEEKAAGSSMAPVIRQTSLDGDGFSGAQQADDAGVAGCAREYAAYGCGGGDGAGALEMGIELSACYASSKYDEINYQYWRNKWLLLWFCLMSRVMRLMLLRTFPRRRLVNGLVCRRFGAFCGSWRSGGSRIRMRGSCWGECLRGRTTG
jgi:Sigma-70 region 2